MVKQRNENEPARDERQAQRSPSSRDFSERETFRADGNDENDTLTDEWNNDDPFERDLYGRGRFDR
jgi:hypothetical protein